MLWWQYRKRFYICRQSQSKSPRSLTCYLIHPDNDSRPTVLAVPAGATATSARDRQLTDTSIKAALLAEVRSCTFSAVETHVVSISDLTRAQLCMKHLQFLEASPVGQVSFHKYCMPAPVFTEAGNLPHIFSAFEIMSLTITHAFITQGATCEQARQ